jgi:hypothetical protein
MSKTQKQSVVEEVLSALPGFNLNKDNAILHLTNQQLENIKANVMNGIINGIIDYNKDVNNHAEVRSYARSMVMNHLKKAKELNGGYSLITSNSGINSGNAISHTSRVKLNIAPKGVNVDVLPQELKDLCLTLV